MSNAELSVFDEKHGDIVLNALDTYEDRMREVAAEAMAAGARISLADADKVRGGLAQLADAVAALDAGTGSATGDGALILVIDAARVLVTAARLQHLLPEPVPAAGSAGTISLRPTAGGWAHMAAMFTEAADAAAETHKAYEALTGRDVEDDEPLDAGVNR